MRRRANFHGKQDLAFVDIGKKVALRLEEARKRPLDRPGFEARGEAPFHLGGGA